MGMSLRAFRKHQGIPFLGIVLSGFLLSFQAYNCCAESNIYSALSEKACNTGASSMSLENGNPMAFVSAGYAVCPRDEVSSCKSGGRDCFQITKPVYNEPGRSPNTPPKPQIHQSFQLHKYVSMPRLGFSQNPDEASPGSKTPVYLLQLRLLI